MKEVLFRMIMLCATLSLLGCSNQNMAFFGDPSPTEVYPATRHYAYHKQNDPKPGSMDTVAASGDPISGPRGMDGVDKSKMTHALDNPIGKSTRWVNENSGTTYTVIPLAKITVNGNPYCRRYSVTATKGSKTKESTGTACVGSNGTWERNS